MSLKSIFIWALLIRFLIMPFTFHPDIKDIHFRVSYLYTNNVFNIYEFLKTNDSTKFIAPDFAYPPLTFFALGTYQLLLTPLLGDDFSKWLNDFGDYKYQAPQLFRYLFSLKLIYLVFDLAVGLILLKLVTKNKQKFALAFWFFNPINLYAIYAIGQFDIIPTFLTLLSFYFWERKKAILSGLTLGLGIAFKSFPLLLLPLFLTTKTNLKDKFLFSTLAISIYLITILPFLNSSAFQHDVLFSGLSIRIFELKIDSGLFEISIFLLLYALYLIFTVINRKVPLYINILVIFLVMFSLTRFHPQWIVWMMPFITLALVNSNLNLKLLTPLFLAYFLYFIFFGDSFLTTGILSPLSPLYLEIPSFTQLIPPNLMELVKSLTQIIFASSAFFVIVGLIKRFLIK